MFKIGSVSLRFPYVVLHANVRFVKTKAANAMKLRRQVKTNFPYVKLAAFSLLLKVGWPQARL